MPLNDQKLIVVLFSICYYSEAAVPTFPNYCTESSLNFSTNSNATAFSEDDTEYATGRRNKTSRVNIVACLKKTHFLFSIFLKTLFYGTISLSFHFFFFVWLFLRNSCQ